MSAIWIKVVITLLLVFGFNPAIAIDDEDKRKFKEQYAMYQSHASRGDWEGALQYAKSSWDLSREILGDNHRNTARLGHNYALNLSRLNQAGGASYVYRQVLSSYKAVFGEDSAELIPLMLDIAGADTSLGNAKKNEKERDKLLKHALELGKEHMGDKSPEYAALLIDVGSLHAFRNSHEFAEWIEKKGYSFPKSSKTGSRYLYDGLKLSKETTGNYSAQTAFAAYNVGRFELQRGRERPSIGYLEEALAIYSNLDTRAPEMQLAVLIELTRAELALDDFEMAAKRHREIGILSPELGSIEAQLIVSVTPDRPSKSSWKNKFEWVTVEYQLDKSGRVIEPVVAQSSGVVAFHSFALEAIEGFLYTPRVILGENVEVTGMEYKFRFFK